MQKIPTAFLAISILVYPGSLRAQWQLDGSALSTAVNDQSDVSIVSDGAGGAIVTWVDLRSGGFDYDIYAQRVSASGYAQWTADGVALCTAADFQGGPKIVADGAGGAIVAWFDFRNGTIDKVYAQRVNASGVIQWAENGVAVCTAVSAQIDPDIVSDGSGGAIVTWHDTYRNGTNSDIYAQRVDASGVTLWAADGVALRTTDEASNVGPPRIVTDGDGGAIVMWPDYRDISGWDIYAQRVNASGAVQWVANGVALCSAAGEQSFPDIAADGAGGAIATWSDARNGIDLYEIYLQRVNASGVVQWAADGVALGNEGGAILASDGVGGVIVVIGVTNYDIYAQRVDASGVAQWTAGGVALCTAADSQGAPSIASDGTGGAFVTWQDNRNGSYNDIYAQRVNPSGVMQWATDGVALCVAAYAQYFPRLVADGAGGAIVAWHDRRSFTNLDVYAQRVDPEGLIPTGVRDLSRARSLLEADNSPNPFSAATMFGITLQHAAALEIDVFDALGRRVRSIDMGQMEAGASQIPFDGLGAHGRALPSGVYLLRVHAGAETLIKKMVIQR